MNIIIFGASGGVGLKTLEQSLNKGYHVRAFVRTPSKIHIQDPHLELFQGNAIATLMLW